MVKRVPRLLIPLLVAAGVAMAGENPPGIMFSTLLENVKMQPGNGYFMIQDKIQAVFIPADAKGKIVLRTADGTDLYRYDWEGELIKAPYVRLSMRGTTDLKTQESYYDYPVLKPGDYVLDFYLGESRFHTFPFSVTVSSSPDPFLGGDLTFLEGAWSRWGYFHFYNADPEQNLVWKIWLRQRSHENVHKDTKIDVRIVSGKGKKEKVLCQSRDDTTYGLGRDWTRYAFDMVNPPVKTSSGEYFKAKDLLGRDGDYTLVMDLDGKTYGRWKFTVKDGKLQYRGRTVRGEADPLTFVEGGRDAWWYEME